ADAGLGRVLGPAAGPAVRDAVGAGDVDVTGHEVRAPGGDGRLDVERQRADARDQAHPLTRAAAADAAREAHRVLTGHVDQVHPVVQLRDGPVVAPRLA